VSSTRNSYVENPEFLNRTEPITTAFTSLRKAENLLYFSSFTLLFSRAQIDSPAGAFDDALSECFIDHVSDFFLIKAGLLSQGGDIIVQVLKTPDE